MLLRDEREFNTGALSAGGAVATKEIEIPVSCSQIVTVFSADQLPASNTKAQIVAKNTNLSIDEVLFDLFDSAALSEKGMSHGGGLPGLFRKTETFTAAESAGAAIKTKEFTLPDSSSQVAAIFKANQTPASNTKAQVIAKDAGTGIDQVKFDLFDVAGTTGEGASHEGASPPLSAPGIPANILRLTYQAHATLATTFDFLVIYILNGANAVLNAPGIPGNFLRFTYQPNATNPTTFKFFHAFILNE